jgi:hypothetical protein
VFTTATDGADGFLSPRAGVGSTTKGNCVIDAMA